MTPTPGVEHAGSDFGFAAIIVMLIVAGLAIGAVVGFVSGLAVEGGL